MNRLLVVALCVGLSVAKLAHFDGDQVLRVETPSLKDVETLNNWLEQLDYDVDVWMEGTVGGFSDVHVAAPFVNAFRNGCPFPSEVFIEDVESMVQRSYAKSQDWFTAYHPIDELNEWLFERVAEYSNIPGLTVELFVLGQSFEGRTIYGISFHGSDPVRTGIFWNGVHHAREWIGPSTTHFLIDGLLSGYASGDPVITNLVNGIDFHIVPVLNVDGYSYTWTNDRLWRKTRSTYNGATIGTDPNRNWDFQWGGVGSSGTPSSGTYRGPFPFSEPEVLAAAQFINDRPNIQGYIDWHSYGQYILSAWGYTPGLPPDNTDLVELGDRMESVIRNVNGNAYLVGPSGATLYPTSGSAPDYTYGASGVKYSYTIELPGNPGGFVLPPEFIIPVGRESFEGAMVFAQQILVEFREK